MPIAIPDFWNLLIASRMVSPRSVPGLQGRFSEVKGSEQGNAITLAQWLISQGVLSRYQAKVLLAGHAGPFVYGEYTVFDRYTVGRLQGAFRALHPQTRHRVLLWFHSGAVVENRQFWSILSEQIATFSRAIHPNLARIYQICDLGQFKFTSLEDLQGESADARLARGPLPWSIGCRMVRQAALGLVRLFELGQLHGAIRPGNLWINPEDNAQLLLPPLARDPLAMPGPIDLAVPDPPGHLQLQVDYLAPEMTQPGQAPGPRTEIYALGCTLFHLVSGRVPFSGRDPLSKLASHAGERIPSLDSATVPAEVGPVLATMMAKDPARRYQHPRQVADALGQILAKLDPDQMQWPASPVPNKLPEFEAWLQPYHVAQDPNYMMTTPDVVMPPILAAGLKPKPATPTTSQPAESPTRAVATTPTVTAATARKPAAVAERVTEARSVSSAVPAHQPPQAIVFPPDDGDFIAMVADRGKRASGRRNRDVMMLAGLLFVAIIVGVVAWFALQKNSGPTAEGGETNPVRQSPAASDDDAKASNDNLRATGDTVETSGAIGDTQPAKEAPQVVPDDGQTLWISPTNGPPLSLAHLAPALQAVLVLRPAELLRHPEGEKLLAALGPEVAAARSRFESLVRTPLSAIEVLTITWVEPLDESATSTIVPMCIVRFAGSPSIEQLRKGWNDGSSPTRVGDLELYRPTAELMAYFPPREKNRGVDLVLGPSAAIQESAKAISNPPLLRREIEKLLHSTDAEFVATLVWLQYPANGYDSSPNGEKWEKLRDWSRSFLGDEIRAAALAAHLTKDSFFVEMRAVGAPDRSADALSRDLRRRLSQLPDAVESFVASLSLQPYGKRVLLRYPPMTKLLNEFTRGGIENDQAVLRCYLPSVAAHNLLLGAELALSEGADSIQVASGNQQSGAIRGAPASVAEKLKQVTSLGFARDTLEKAIQMLADDIGVKYEILGSDLQADGITKNQSFGMDEKNKPADEILRMIMFKANPDGKLIYVVKSRQPGGEETLYITTRAAAAKRGDILPPELATPPKK